MPLHKKITAIVVFALCGFAGGWISQANATIIGSQYDTSVLTTGHNCFGSYNCESIGTGWTQTPDALSFYVTNWTASGAETVGLWSVGFAWACSINVGISHPLVAYTGWVTASLLHDSGSTNPQCGSAMNPALTYQVVTDMPTRGSSSAGADMAYELSNNPSFVGPAPTVTSIDSTSPSGTISSSSPLTITVSATIASADLASSTANGGTLRLFSWVGGIDTAFVSPSHSVSMVASGATTTTYTVNTDLPAGKFKIYASVYALDSYGAFGPTYAATTTFFTLNSSYFEHLVGTSTPANLAYKNAPCGITDVSGCIQNALAFLFYPTVSPGQAFTTVSSAAQGKFPFVYVYQLGAIRTSLLSSSSTAPTGLTINLWKIPNHATSTIELISQTKVAAVPFAGTIYTVLTWLIWLGMAEYIYYRVIRMHDVNTPPT